MAACNKAAHSLYFCPVVYSIYLLSSFFSPNLSGRRLHVYHTSIYTRCGLSANLECRFEMCCTRLAGNAGPQNRQKFATWARSHKFVGLYLRN